MNVANTSKVTRSLYVSIVFIIKDTDNFFEQRILFSLSFKIQSSDLMFPEIKEAYIERLKPLNE